MAPSPTAAQVYIRTGTYQDRYISGQVYIRTGTFGVCNKLGNGLVAVYVVYTGKSH